MSAFEVRGYISNLHTLEGALYNAAAQALRSAIQAAVEDVHATTLFNDGTGELRRNTTGQSDGLTGEVTADTSYAKYVEDGTPPHVITARNARALRFVQNGEVRFAASVQHPGTAERPFMQHASEVGEKTLEYGVDYFASFAIERFGASGG